MTFTYKIPCFDLEHDCRVRTGLSNDTSAWAYKHLAGYKPGSCLLYPTGK